ncbi:MAG: hypothetical protein UX66_C0013G0005 [Parcubacteria group bacterium GW2011_GWF2_46_8]|nr:MAG: hypothetical protein UX66_C0013G0005 [Parcubacteria group bacterium GW2011_GWF2_46_8]
MAFNPGDYLKHLIHKDEPGVPGPSDKVAFRSFAEYIRDILNVCDSIKQRYENDADSARRLIAVSAETLRTSLLHPGGMGQFVQEMRLSFLQVLAGELVNRGRKVELKDTGIGIFGLNFGVYRDQNEYKELVISESGKVDVRWAFEKEGVH